MNSEDRRFVVFFFSFYYFYSDFIFVEPFHLTEPCSDDCIVFRSFLFHFILRLIRSMCLCSIFQYDLLLLLIFIRLTVWSRIVLRTLPMCNAKGSIWCVVRIYCLISSPFLLQTIRYPCTWCSKKKLYLFISLVAGYRCLFVINSKMLKLKPTTQMMNL